MHLYKQSEAGVWVESQRDEVKEPVHFMRKYMQALTPVTVSLAVLESPSASQEVQRAPVSCRWAPGGSATPIQ